MLSALYNFNKTSKQLFLDLIELRTGVDLNEDEITVGTPVKQGHLATLVPVSALPDSSLKGTVELTYDRLDLNRFFYGIPLVIETEDLVDEAFISNWILDKWFILVEADDITIETTDYGLSLPKKLTVAAKEESLAWVGSLEVWVLEPNHMSIIFGSNSIAFSGDNKRRNAYIYSIEKELVDPPIQVINYAIGGRIFHTLTATTVEFLDNLSTMTEDQWVIEDTVTDFNLKNAEVTYHGPLDSSNTTFVIVIQLTNLCKNLFGNLIIRYNPV